MHEVRANSSNTKPLAHTSIAKGALGVKIADVRDGSGAMRVVVCVRCAPGVSAFFLRVRDG